LGVAAIAVLLLVAACASSPPRPEAAIGKGADIARFATQLIGTPYHFGGADQAGFDCSGLAVYVHEAVGLEIPRTAAKQSVAAQPVAAADLQPGDLLFFRIAAHHVDHVGIYAGAGRFVHAPRRGEVVSYASLDDPYYRKRWVRAGRFWSHP
jgi:cell wall-associated NlpC family hydrolase